MRPRKTPAGSRTFGASRGARPTRTSSRPTQLATISEDEDTERWSRFLAERLQPRVGIAASRCRRRDRSSGSLLLGPRAARARGGSRASCTRSTSFPSRGARGVGRALMMRETLTRLRRQTTPRRCCGFSRTTRALAASTSARGWHADGGVMDGEWLGTVVREVRYRIDLASAGRAAASGPEWPMRADQVIATHGNTDFDAFGAMLAARLLYPRRVVAIGDAEPERPRLLPPACRGARRRRGDEQARARCDPTPRSSSRRRARRGSASSRPSHSIPRSRRSSSTTMPSTSSPTGSQRMRRFCRRTAR